MRGFTFTYKGRKFVNYDFSDEETLQQLKEQLNATDEEINELLRRLVIEQLISFTDQYIRQKFSSIDEDLADLVSEAQVIEGRILYLAAKEGVSITTDEVKQKIAFFIAGSYTQDDAINDLKEKGLSDETIQKILPLLARGVEIAKTLNWKEEIWQKEAELENQLKSISLEKLLKLNLYEWAYKQYEKIK